MLACGFSSVSNDTLGVYPCPATRGLGATNGDTEKGGVSPGVARSVDVDGEPDEEGGMVVLPGVLA